MRHFISYVGALFLLSLLAGSLAACDLFGSGDEGRGPRLEGIPGKIVFSASRYENGEPIDDGNIYVIDAGGTHQLTNFGEGEGASNPAWSPDGNQIAFSTFLKATTLGPSLYLMDADGSDIRPLKRLPSESPRVLFGEAPVWSPDGSRVAFYVCTNCEIGGFNYEIFLVKRPGGKYEEGDVTRLTDHLAGDRFPAWSPDGKQVTFVSNRDYHQATEDRWRQDLYVVNADGSNLRRLTEMGRAGPPTWSPDGTKIAFNYRISNPGVFVYDFATGDTKELKTDLKYYGRPMWSSNGKRLLVPGTTHEGEHVLQLISLSGEILSTIGRPYDSGGFDWYSQTR